MTKEQRRIAFKKVYEKATARRVELKSVPCADCNIQYPHYVMQFDHRPTEVKSYNMAHLHSMNKLEIEAEKCDIVCANCHAERTWSRKAER